MFRLSSQKISIPILRPNPGLTHVKTAYIEGEKLSGNTDKKVLLAVHGNPGSSKQYKDIMPMFIRNDFRTLVPDFPGFGETPNGLGTYGLSTEGRADFLYNFMQKKDIPKPNVMLSFSSASFTTIEHVLNTQTQPGAIVFASPNGFESAVNLRPLFLLNAMATVDSKLLYLIYQKMIGLKMPTEILSSTARVANSWDYEAYRAQVKAAKAMLSKTPILVVYGTKDKLFTQAASKDFVRTLGIGKEGCFEGVKGPEEYAKVLAQVDSLYRKTGLNKFCIQIQDAGHTLIRDNAPELSDLCCLASEMK